jgi:hypothetical protein
VLPFYGIRWKHLEKGASCIDAFQLDLKIKSTQKEDCNGI